MIPRIPWLHAVEPKPNDPPQWRCTAKACGWNGTREDAIRHAIRHQWDDRKAA